MRFSFMISLVALGLMLSPAAHAAGVTTTASRTRSFVDDKDAAFPGTTQVQTLYAAYAPSFNVVASEGRGTSTLNATWLEGSGGFRWTGDGTVEFAAASGTPDDVGDLLLEHYFSTTQTVTFDFSGVYTATGLDDSSLFSVELRDQGADLVSALDDVVIYSEVGATGGSNNFSYTLGTNPSVGNTSGTIGPSNYRIVLGAQLRDRYGDGAPALGTLTQSVQIGAVPEPSTPAVLVLGVALLALLRRSV